MSRIIDNIIEFPLNIADMLPFRGCKECGKTIRRKKGRTLCYECERIMTSEQCGCSICGTTWLIDQAKKFIKFPKCGNLGTRLYNESVINTKADEETKKKTRYELMQ